VIGTPYERATVFGASTLSSPKAAPAAPSALVIDCFDIPVALFAMTDSLGPRKRRG
jgi:hypothetical protein